MSPTSSSTPAAHPRPSCATCRRRKVRCTVSSDSGVCDQCLRRIKAGEDDGDCVIIEHRRGRRFGSRNVKTIERARRAAGVDPTFLSTESGGSSSSTQPTTQPTTQPFAVLTPTPTRDPITSSTSTHHLNTLALSPTSNVASLYPPSTTSRTSFLTSDSRSTNVPSASSTAWQSRNVPPPPSEVLERSPLILLDRAYEEQGDPGPSERTAKSKKAQQSRFRSRLDVNNHLDPITIDVCEERSADDLFAFFFAHLAGYAGFLDPAVHTLNHVRSHSTFLLCVILYVSARHHPTTAASPRLITVSDVLERHIQTKVWPNILLGDFKSVWICQAAMVWATFLPPARKGEDDIGWSLFAHAIRIAAEIGLNCDPPIIDEGDEQDLKWAERNRERTWLTCFIADRSWATQAGRPPLLAEDAKILHVDRWLECEGVILEDASIVALVKLRRIISQYQRSTDSSTSLPPWEDALEEWRSLWLGWKWSASYRLGRIGRIYYHYAKMIIRLPRIDTSSPLAIVSDAAELLHFSTREMDVSVLHYAHNNVFTMISFALVILIQFRTCLASNHDLQLTIYEDMILLHDRMQSAQHANAHCQGIVGWHSRLLSKLIMAWSTSEPATGGQVDGPMPDDLMEALLCLDPTWLDMDFSASFDFDGGLRTNGNI